MGVLDAFIAEMSQQSTDLEQFSSINNCYLNTVYRII